MPFASCPHCTRSMRTGSLVKEGSKYLYFRCRLDGSHQWRIAKDSDEYINANYRALKYLPEPFAKQIYIDKIKSTVSKRLNIPIDEIDNYDWNSIYSFFENDYSKAITFLRKSNTPDRLAFLEAYKN